MAAYTHVIRDSASNYYLVREAFEHAYLGVPAARKLVNGSPVWTRKIRSKKEHLIRKAGTVIVPTLHDIDV